MASITEQLCHQQNEHTILLCHLSDVITERSRSLGGIGSHRYVVLNKFLQTSQLKKKFTCINYFFHYGAIEGLQWLIAYLINDDDAILVDGRNLLPSHIDSSGGW